MAPQETRIPGLKNEKPVTYSEKSAAGKPSATVYAVHYSPQPRAMLDSSRWGANESRKQGKRGQAGHEREWVDSSSDARLKHRIYAYITNDAVVEPKPGVGLNPHPIVLDMPLYDLASDPEGIVEENNKPQYKSIPGMPGKMIVQPTMADIETAILDAGYGGYVSVGIGKKDAVVLLGERKIPLYAACETPE